jgi:nucleotide-binding universal stress UspA family protein
MNILITTDGSEDAGHALDFMLRFPLPRHSTITLLSVVADIPMVPGELDALDDTQNVALEQACKRLLEDAEMLVEREGKRLHDAGWAAETMVGNGSIVDEILRVAGEIDADLIVLGSKGTGMAERFLLGSVSGRVLARASCSVLVVKKKTAEARPSAIEAGACEPCRIMLTYDSSDIAKQALSLCASLPLKADARIHVVYVMPMITAYRQDVRQHLNTIWQQKKQTMQDKLDHAVGSLQWTTANVETELREADNVSDELLTAAEEAGDDLIMVGCKDRGKIRSFLHGSITRRIARHAQCSVWVVRDRNREA